MSKLTYEEIVRLYDEEYYGSYFVTNH